MASTYSKQTYQQLADQLAPSPDARLAMEFLLKNESSYGQNPNIQTENKYKALGVMQFIPSTAQQYGVIDRLDPKQALAGGYAYWMDNLKKFNDPIQATVAHQTGVGAMQKAVTMAEKKGGDWAKYLPPEGQVTAQRARAFLGVTYAQPTPQQTVSTATNIGQQSTTAQVNTGTDMALTIPDNPAPQPANDIQPYTRLKQAGIAVQAINDFGNNWAQGTIAQNNGNTAFRNSRGAAGSVGRATRNAQGKIITQTAASGVDVSSQSSRGNVALQGIYGAQAQAAEMNKGDAAKIEGDLNNRLSHINALMSVVGGFINAKAVGMEEAIPKKPLASVAPEPDTLYSMGTGRGGWHG